MKLAWKRVYIPQGCRSTQRGACNPSIRIKKVIHIKFRATGIWLDSDAKPSMLCLLTGFGIQISDNNSSSLPPDRSCLMRPWLLKGSTGRKSLNQEISGSGMPLAAHSMVAVRVRSTTFSWGPMSILGKPNGNRSSGRMKRRKEYIQHKESKHWVRLRLDICRYCISS